MSNTNAVSRGDVKRATAEVRVTPTKKLSTGEYRQVLRQQYERMAKHQQIIEAECCADSIH